MTMNIAMMNEYLSLFVLLIGLGTVGVILLKRSSLKKIFLSFSKSHSSYYQELLDQSIPISKTDLKGNITAVNQAFTDITGYEKHELLGKNHNILRHEDVPDSIYKEFWGTLTSDKIWHGEMQNRRKDGSTFWFNVRVHPELNRRGKKIGYIAVRQDITAGKKMEILASLDPLTKVYNRSKFNHFVEHEISMFKRYNISSTLVLCDIDHFKRVNDQYGHLAGDEILVSIVKLIKQGIRECDLLARWGGEEFALLLPATSGKEALIVVEKIRERISDSAFPSVGRVTVSFGVAEIEEAEDEISWFKHADDALYRAKEHGRNRVMSKV